MSAMLNILYVDDDPDIRTIVALALGMDEGIELRVASSGVEALAIVDEGSWRPDAVVLDVMMPGMDGTETLRTLRKRPGMEMIPMLFMTAKGRDAELNYYRDIGAVGVILKPFDPLQLATEIRTLVART